MQWAEMGDVAGLIAPKPVLAECAREDKCFPWPYTAPIVARLREVYHVAEVDDQLIINIYDDDHRYHGDGILEFWDRLP